MATGVVSGAVALLLEQKADFRLAKPRRALQMTSLFMPEEG